MKDVERILVPVDGSAGSDKAVDVAVLVAKAAGAAIDLLHVSYFAEETDDETAAQASWLPDSVMKSSAREAAEVLARARRRIPAEVTVAEQAMTGIPAEQIVAFAKSHGAETIVIGGRGLGLVEGFLVGSVSQAVMETAPGNVILVK